MYKVKCRLVGIVSGKRTKNKEEKKAALEAIELIKSIIDGKDYLDQMREMGKIWSTNAGNTIFNRRRCKK
jgi:hypothetical protein